MGERGEALPPSPVRAELIDFTIERQRHRRFVGRENVLAQLDEWLLGPGEAGWVVVTGGLGMGKTAYDKCKEILAYKKDNKLCK